MVAGCHAYEHTGVCEYKASLFKLSLRAKRSNLGYIKIRLGLLRHVVPRNDDICF